LLANTNPFLTLLPDVLHTIPDKSDTISEFGMSSALRCGEPELPGWESHTFPEAVLIVHLMPIATDS
jgi:hypothetical protein